MAHNTAKNKDAEDTIGQRARVIRRRRGLSLQTTADLAGISKSYLSMLEGGQRSFERRGLIEDLARALGCAVSDLTGEQNPVPDRRARAASAAIPALNRALYDADLDDVPDMPHRPVPTLVSAATAANVAADHGEYDQAGKDLGALITELQVAAVTGTTEQARAALESLVEACIVAGRLARITGNAALSVTAAQRGYAAAQRLERPDLIGLSVMSEAGGLMRLGARRRAVAVASKAAVRLADDEPGPTPANTATAQARGMLHLHLAMLGAREHDAATVETHLGEARELAKATGEQNLMEFHFGPTNTAVWELGIGVENDLGPVAAQRFAGRNVNVAHLGSRGRASAVHFDLARAWAQAGGVHDDKVIRELDMADRLAPVKVRSDPIARDIGLDLRRRARRRVWELDSLLRRFGVA
jgi:transcriptional regulator with XRE-family HTH domain